MSDITVQVGREVFRWGCSLDFAHHGAKQLRDAGVHRIVLVDAKGRLCWHGRHLNRAERDNAFPIIAYDKESEAE